MNWDAPTESFIHSIHIKLPIVSSVLSWPCFSATIEGALKVAGLHTADNG